MFDFKSLYSNPEFGMFVSVTGFYLAAGVLILRGFVDAVCAFADWLVDKLRSRRR